MTSYGGLKAQQRPATVPNEGNAVIRVRPNLIGQMDRPLRYTPDHGDFVIENGPEFFNRSLYGGNTAFRVDGGDRPEFILYLPGRGGNLRFGIRSAGKAKWLKDAAIVKTRYRPGELIYEIRDPDFGPGAEIRLELLAYAETEGLVARVTAKGLGAGSGLIWAYGGVDGQRGARDGDIGTERVPISEYFQFQPEFAQDNRFTIQPEGFTLASKHATIAGAVPAGAQERIAPAADWNDLPKLLAAAPLPGQGGVLVGEAPISNGAPLLLSLQRISDTAGAASDLKVYRDVTTQRPKRPAPQSTTPLLPAFTGDMLPQHFSTAQKHFDDLRSKVVIQTPDPFLDAAMGALNIVSDALWDQDAHAIMHGAIAWRTKLLGWRGPYVLDELGWHKRALENFNTWLPHQDMSPIGPIPAADAASNLARSEAGLHSNGDLSHSHYDMNMVFMDELFRHLLWTGDKKFARQAWPVIQRHIAWERRLFRREYGTEKLPLYEAYADIWASDDLYYNGGGSAYASAYNVYANRMAARVAGMIGENPAPYDDEAQEIQKAMRALLWMPDRGAYAEYKDVLGRQLVHADYGLWNFYHTVDEEAVTAREAFQMGMDLTSHMRAIPISGPGVPNDQPYHVFSESDWMPYSWSINNVVMEESMHTALALWESGHPGEAYSLAKGAILASMYMGISPGNVGTMQYPDVYRRESQRDFGDSAGTMARTIIEGLFGIHPDALAGTLTIAPGFPADWTHARLGHPDLGVRFQRDGLNDNWDITQTGQHFQKLVLRIPAAFSKIEGVQIDGRPVSWHFDPQSVGRPMLEITTPLSAGAKLHVRWAGEPITPALLASAKPGVQEGEFTRMSLDQAIWWTAAPKAMPVKPATMEVDWSTPKPRAVFRQVDLSAAFNDSVTSIFVLQKYLKPRSDGVSLALPWQGAGAWAGHVKLLPEIDDSGLRKVAGLNQDQVSLPNGVSFRTPSQTGAKNILFTSQWENYPHEAKVAVTGKAERAYLLMAGSTNFMQTRMDNGEVRFNYTDGTSSSLALRNPETWWPIEQDYFIDDYQFPLQGSLPPRIDLKTGDVRLLDANAFKGKGGEIQGGAATVLKVELDPAKELSSVTLSTFTNDSVIGLMGLTFETQK